MKALFHQAIAIAMPAILLGLGSCNFMSATGELDGSTKDAASEDGSSLTESESSTASTEKPTIGGSPTPVSSIVPFTIPSSSALASASATSSPTPVPPTAPTDLYSTTTNGTSIKINWTDNATNETSYEAERCAGFDCTSFEAVNTTLAAGSGNYTTTGLANGSVYRLRVRAANSGGKSAWLTSSNLIAFSGLNAADNVAGDRMTLQWTNVASAASYSVYNTSSGTAVFVTTVAAPVTDYTVTGLTPATQYSFRVRMTSTSGLTDTNSNDISATTSAVSVTHGGWWNVKAVGATTPYSGSGITAVSYSVELKWKAMTPSSGSITSYNVYRATASGQQNFGAPLATGVSADATNCATYSNAACRYTDTSAGLVAGTAYYYVVRPVVGSSVITTSQADSEIKVVLPPDNMALVHRWVANREMCELIGQSATIDRNNNYRCDYASGQGAVGGKLDVGGSYFIDIFEMGCTYSVAPQCDASNGCLGTNGAPGAGTGNPNDVYYSRGGAGDFLSCFTKTDGTTWKAAKDGSLATADRVRMSGNSPGLPPLVNVSQSMANTFCAARSVSVGGVNRARRLPTRREQILAAAFAPGLSDSTISTYETGPTVSSDGYCNTNAGAAYSKGAGAGNDFNDEVKPAKLDTLPTTFTKGIWTVRTGSAYTANCVSRYGVQDLVGNAWEWASDQLASCNTGAHTCAAQTSGIDVSNTDWNGFDFNGNEGPGAGGGNLTNWAYSAMSYAATRFNLPLGLPVVTAANLGSGAINTDFNVSILHGDGIWLNTDASVNIRGAQTGGSYASGNLAGRFALDLSDDATVEATDTGFRCAVSAE